MLKQLLHDNWTVRAVGDTSRVPDNVRDVDVPAHVPGCVHLDLLRAGLIPDPYIGKDELLVQWIGETDWEFRTHIKPDVNLMQFHELELVCDGLDTVAEIRLNGHLIGNTFNMHHPHRFSVKGAMHQQDNELVIRFRSALHYAKEQEQRYGPLPHAGEGLNPLKPHHFVRKNSCNMGWDWGPCLITCGMWLPIRLEAWNDVRIAAVRPLTTYADAQRAAVHVHVDLAHGTQPSPSSTQSEISFELADPDGKTIATSLNRTVDRKIAFEVEVKHPRRWYPVGHGEQPQYRLTVRAGDDSWSKRIGIKTVRLNTDPDPGGARMQLEVNGKPIFCKGANWIPDDVFVAGVDEPTYRKRLRQALDANMNMIRIWGGGLYETDKFYEICSEMGLMVWQDFTFACAMYPEEEPYRTLVLEEAHANVARLCRHASLTMFNGCNENIWAAFDWGPKWWEARFERTWGLGYYLDMLPNVVAELAPTIPYWPASPYSGSIDLTPNLVTHGNVHLWANYPHTHKYRDFKARFVSEFGALGPCNYATLARAVPQEHWKVGDDVFEHHQKAGGATEVRINQPMREFFAFPDDFHDWYFLAQLVQARSIQTGVEFWRSTQPYCMGALYWQLNDCWPVHSWAAVDGDGRRKLLWYATRKFFAPRMLTLQPTKTNWHADQDFHAVLINETPEPWHSELTLQHLDMPASTLTPTRFTAAVDVPAFGTQTIVLPAHLCKRRINSSKGALVSQVDDKRAFYYFRPDKELAYPEAKLNTTVTKTDAGYDLELQAQSFIRDLCVFADHAAGDAEVSEQMLTMLPGDKTTMHIATAMDIAPDLLTSRPVMRCVNEFGRR